MKVTIEEGWTVLRPSCCGATFAMPDGYVEEYKRKKRNWYCVNCGSTRIFTGQDKDKVKIKELERKIAQKSTETMQARAAARDTSERYQRMRKRVFAGVCICCNRSFDNLARHMKTKHSDAAESTLLKHKRTMLGMTQLQLASDLGISGVYISNFENEKNVPENAASVLSMWAQEEIT